MIKSRMIKWAGNVTGMGKMNAYKVWWENQKERGH
jgi:hypothetical protein